MLRTVYMDYAATTPMAPEAAEAMRPYLAENYGNPSGIYALARRSREAVKSPAQNCRYTKYEPENIYFTSGGTESDNWALIAAAEAFEPRGQAHHYKQDRTSCYIKHMPLSGKKGL